MICLSSPGWNLEYCPFLADFELTFSLRIVITSFFKISIPLKMLFELLILKSQNSHLSSEISMLTPFCIFLVVSTVRNNSTIRQFGDSGSLVQSYSRKLIIWKSRIALMPLKTLFVGLLIQSLILIEMLLLIDVDPVAWDSFINRLFKPFIVQSFVGFEFDDKIKIKFESIK